MTQTFSHSFIGYVHRGFFIFGANGRLRYLTVSLPKPSSFTLKIDGIYSSLSSTATLNASYLPKGLIFFSSQTARYWETVGVGTRLLTTLWILTISPEASFKAFSPNGRSFTICPDVICYEVLKLIFVKLYSTILNILHWFPRSNINAVLFSLFIFKIFHFW